MLSSRLRKLVSTHCVWWCLCGVLLTLCQPFLAVHFRCDGWEDEPAVRIRVVSDTTQFEADGRADHPDDRETTLFAQSAASVDLPNALEHGLDGLMALVFLLLPLTIALVRLVEPVERHLQGRVPTRSGAPPPTAPWRRLPPKTAPPLTT
ncbi:hypothetical protein ACSFA8_20940 [Variovorax sp. RT4R15]|uniref:hypothetical protein n=1 Tax=Variovorax sp. RT4R15 TaxID=3443737 RepID=UPI003F4610EB